MGIKLDPRTNTYSVSFARRHPITRVPTNLRRRGFKTKAEAKRAYDQIVIDVDRKLHENITPTWETVFDRYHEECRNRGLTEKTLHNQEKCLKAHTFEAWANKTVDTITTTEIRELLHAKLGSNRPSHQKHFLRMVRAVFTYAVEAEYIDRNPTPTLKFKIGDKVRQVLTEEQVNLFLKRAREMNDDWYPHWTLALYTGMRNGELYALTWQNVNLERRTIVVNSSWNALNGFKDTKSGDDRVVEIAEALLPLLVDLKNDDPESDWVLPRMERWDRGRQAHDLRLFLSGMGLPQLRFHDLRATWATLLLSRGIEPIKVMKMGGWADMETMMIYNRMAGVDIRGSLNGFKLHEHETRQGNVLQFGPGSNQ